MQCIPFTFVYTGPAGVRAKRRTGAGQKLPRFSMPVTRSGIANPAERERNAVAKKQNYGNESITSLKGADRVRLRPAVIFGSDGLDGCEHAIFEILSNSIDEARQGYGKEITITRFLDQSIEVEDHGRGIPVDFNKRENRYNWELVFCEMYAGGKYNNNDGGNYDFSLGLNGLGLCATQYASEYMDADIRYDGFRYTLHFERGENVGGLKKEPYAKKKDTGSVIRWKPDLKVFTDIAVPVEYYTDTLRRQAIVNAGVKFIFKNEVAPKKFETTVFCYENGIEDHVRELCGDDAMTSVQFWQSEKRVRDREDLPLYNVKINVALAFSNRLHLTEYYHNSSWLEYGGRAGQGRAERVRLSDRRVPEAERQVQQVRKQNQVSGYRGLPRPRHVVVLDDDLVREPDEEGHQQQGHPGGHGRDAPPQSGGLLHRKTRWRPRRSARRCSSTSAPARTPSARG